MQKGSRLVKSEFPDGKNIVTEEKELSHFCTAHYHDFYEIDVILDGNGESVCNGESFPIKRGMVTFMSPEGVHSYRLSEESKMKEINIQFTYDAIDAKYVSFFNLAEKNVAYVSEETLQKIYSLFLLLDGDTDMVGEKEYRSKLLECIILLFKDEFEQKEKRISDLPSSLQRALIFMSSNFKDDPGMSRTAEHVFLNENYFCTMFRKKTGKSYKQYMRELKLDHARKLLLYTELPIARICYDSGYNSQSHFNREFLARFGFSPMKMRQEAKQKS